jgi:uncharacterized protein (UPF0210 family)
VLPYAADEILETIQMVSVEQLDIRTVTLGLSILDCAGPDAITTAGAIYDRITLAARDLVPGAAAVAAELGIPIANTRIAVTPLALVGASNRPLNFLALAKAMDAAAVALGVDFIGGCGALVAGGMTSADLALIAELPQILSQTERVCSGFEAASSRAGINIDAVSLLAEALRQTAALSADRDSVGCAKLVIFANAVEDNPFMAGAFHGVGQPQVCLNVGVSGPGVITRVVRANPQATLGQLAEAIKRMAFKVTRAGELVGTTLADRLGVPFGCVDLSLAPSPIPGDSVGEVLEAMGLERVGVPGSTAALALLTDAVKRGGVMASSRVGGLSGAFIPVSEDTALIRAANEGLLTVEKLEALTAVCSVGLDMIAIPGVTPVETIAGLIADELTIGMMNHKTVGVRLIPVAGKEAGEWAEFGGLLGHTPILPVRGGSPAPFIRRGGRIPGPMHGLRN